MKEKRAGAVLGAAGGLTQGELLVSTNLFVKHWSFWIRHSFFFLLVSGRRRFLSLKTTMHLQKMYETSCGICIRQEKTHWHHFF
jgi:hypothetical protein